MQGLANRPARIWLGTLETVVDPSRESDWVVYGSGRSKFQVGWVNGLS